MDESSLLSAILSDSLVRDLAGTTYYERGVDYVRRNLVVSLEHSGDALEAVVSGTEDYGVVLAANGKQLIYTCECPLGDEGAFCKHCVATALAWLAQPKPAPAAKSSVRAGKLTEQDIRTALSGQPKETLVDWLMEWSAQDKDLRQRLNTVAISILAPEALVDEAGRQLQAAIRVRSYLEYNKVRAYAARVDAALDEVANLLERGHAEAIVDLCEEAMGWLETASGQVDDSNGHVGGLMERVSDLHLEACEQARLDPESLGLRVFRLEMKPGSGYWGRAHDHYAHLLGETGLAAFRRAAEKAWAGVPARTSADAKQGGDRHYAITGIMQALAQNSGDVEQLVAVLEKDLTSSGQYVRIAEAYRKAGKHEKALEWAERGMALYSGWDGAGLRSIVAEEYRRAERHADALRMVWADFRAAPQLRTYLRLEEFARAAEDWEDWRERALAHIRRLATEKDGKPDYAWQSSQGRSLLVEVFLYEGKNEEAWREAQNAGCSDPLWLQLAETRAKTHPEDACEVYLRLGEAAVAAVSDGRYERGVTLLEKAAALMHGLGRSSEFEDRFNRLRMSLKAKRNLQKLADDRRQFLYLR